MVSCYLLCRLRLGSCSAAPPAVVDVVAGACNVADGAATAVVVAAAAGVALAVAVSFALAASVALAAGAP